MSSRGTIYWALILTIMVVASSAFFSSVGDLPAVGGMRAAGDGGWSGNITVAQGSGLKTPSMVLANGTLHVAFLNNGVQYSRSTDGGTTWSEPVILGPQGQDTPKTPVVAAEGDLVVVVWSAKKDTTTKALFWARSEDAGKTFEDSAYLAGSNGKEANQPKALIKAGIVYIIWADNRDDPLLEPELYLKTSVDGGGTWKPDKRVTSSLKASFNPDFDVVGNTIHVVWEDEKDGPHWSYYKNSTDGGNTFGPTVSICGGLEASMPNIAAEGNKVHVTWWQPSYNLYYIRSDDAGVSWGAAKTIVAGGVTRSEGVIEAQGAFLEFVYNENGKLFYINSTDAGDNWGTPAQIGDGLNPSGFGGYWNPLVTTDTGSFMVFNDGDSLIKFRYKGLLTDLSIAPSDVSFGQPFRVKDATLVNITATVHNTGAVAAWGAEVLFYNGTEAPLNFISSDQLGPIAVGGTDIATATWEPPVTAPTLVIRVNGHGPMESDLNDNTVTMPGQVSNYFPIPSLKVSPESALTLEEFEFDGSGSKDPDGTVASYDFDFGDGNGTGWAPNPVVKHSYHNDGNYTIILQVKDDKSGTSDWRQVAVTVGNRGPSVNISGVSEKYLTGTRVEVSGNLSGDPDGTIVSYRWDFGDGNSTTGQNADHFYTDDGDYIIALEVKDDDGAANSTSVQVTILNRGPSAVLKANRTDVLKGEPVWFDASGSSDLDGTVVKYLWDWGDGKTSTGSAKVQEHKYAKRGTIVVNLTITVSDKFPVAVATADKNEALTFEFISFNGGGSQDPDGRIEVFRWDFGDGISSSAAATKHSFQKAGEYRVNLTVTDDAGQSASATLTVTILNRKPVAEIRAEPMVAYVNDTINFSASYSKDEDGKIANYTWDFSDGSEKAEGLNVSHVFKSTGNFTVNLKVVDDNKGVGETSLVITVRKPYTPPPPPPNDGDGGRLLLMAGVAAGLIIALVAIIITVLFLRKRRRKKLNDDLSDLMVQPTERQQPLPPQNEAGPAEPQPVPEPSTPSPPPVQPMKYPPERSGGEGASPVEQGQMEQQQQSGPPPADEGQLQERP